MADPVARVFVVVNQNGDLATVPAPETVGERVEVFNQIVGGHFEQILLPTRSGQPLRSDDHVVRVVLNEEGWLIPLKPNCRYPRIAGNLVVVREEETDEGPDLVGFPPVEAQRVLAYIQSTTFALPQALADALKPTEEDLRPKIYAIDNLEEWCASGGTKGMTELNPEKPA